jgi:hypothetical protein
MDKKRRIDYLVERLHDAGRNVPTEDRYSGDPLRLLDAITRLEGDQGSFEFTVRNADPEILGPALQAYMPGRGVALRECIQAVDTRQEEYALIDTVMGKQHGVWCVKCRRSTFSSYHDLVCGDEDVLTIDDYISMAMHSDSPEDFI